MSAPSFFYRRSNDGRRYAAYLRGRQDAIGYVVKRGDRWQATTQFGVEVGPPHRRRDHAAQGLLDEVEVGSGS